MTETDVKYHPYGAYGLAGLLFLVFLACARILPASDAANTINVFSKWAVAHQGNDYAIAATAQKNHSVILKFANSLEKTVQEMTESFTISLEIPPKDLKRLADLDEKPECAIFIDGEATTPAIKQEKNSLLILDQDLLPRLLVSDHENFVISFPQVTLSYTFPLQGLKAAWSRVKNLRMQIELKHSSQQIARFSTYAAITIVSLVLAAICAYVLTLYRARHEPRPQPESESQKDGPRAEKKSRKDNPAREKRRARQSAASDAFNNQRENAYQRREKSGDSASFSERARFSYAWERADFGRNSASSLASDVREAFGFFNLEPGAPFDKVREKRTFLLKAYHPDRFQSDKTSEKIAEEQTKKVNYYFDILARHYKKI